MKFYNSAVEERIGYDFYCDIANNIVELRKSMGLTQKDLAERTGIKEHRIVNMENVKIRIGMNDVEKLSKALNVSMEYLIDAEPDWGGMDCLYLIWPDSAQNFKLYMNGSSKRMTFLKYDELFKKMGVRYSGSRERFFVKLVAVPVSAEDFQSRFPKRTEEDLPIEPEVGGE